MSLMQRSLAELIGTFWLVLGGCGAAVLAAVLPGPDRGRYISASASSASPSPSV